LILAGIIAAKSKPFVLHLNVLSYNNCPSFGRYLFVNPVRYIFIYLSSYVLTQSETDLLRRGLNFCPIPPPKPDSVDKDIEAFPRGLSLRKYYSPDDISELGQQSMYQPSALEKLNERDLRECHNKPSSEPYLNS